MLVAHAFKVTMYYGFSRSFSLRSTREIVPYLSIHTETGINLVIFWFHVGRPGEIQSMAATNYFGCGWSFGLKEIFITHPLPKRTPTLLILLACITALLSHQNAIHDIRVETLVSSPCEVQHGTKYTFSFQYRSARLKVVLRMFRVAFALFMDFSLTKL